MQFLLRFNLVYQRHSMTNSAMIPDPWSEPSMHRYPGRIYGQGDAGAEARQRLTKNTTSKKMPLKAASINLGKIHQQTAGFAAGMGQTADGTFTFKWY